MTTAGSLLEQASSVLRQATAHSNRAASWIARASLETAVDDLLALKHRGAPGAAMRSRLTILQVAFADDDATVPARAEYAWQGLSQACHHHAFELTPSASEVQHLIDLVGTLISDAPPV